MYVLSYLTEADFFAAERARAASDIFLRVASETTLFAPDFCLEALFTVPVRPGTVSLISDVSGSLAGHLTGHSLETTGGAICFDMQERIPYARESLNFLVQFMN